MKRFKKRRWTMNFDATTNLRREMWNDGIRECGWCGRAFDGFKDCTVDHRVPRSRGGRTIRENCLLACERCNNKKGDMMPLQFLRAMPRLGIKFQESTC